MEKTHPVNWVHSSLEELSQFVIGGDWGEDPEKSLNDDSISVLCIRGSELKEWTKYKGKTSAHRKVKKSSLDKRRLRLGDILVEISGGGPDQPVGRTVIIDKDVLEYQSAIPKVCTNFFRLVRLNNNLEKSFINFYLQYFYQTGKIVKYQGGTNNLRNLRFSEYSKIEIPLPPLPEQTRIVAKLDALFAHLDTLKTKLDRIPELLKNFRQQVLTQAVTGKLTEEWRNKNDKIESGDKLLKKIIDSRLNSSSNIKLNLSPINVEFSNLPPSWTITRLVNVASIIGGVTKGRNLNGKTTINLPYLRVANVQDGFLDLTEIKLIEVLPEDKCKYELIKGDILFTEGGDRDKLGRGTLWNCEIANCIHQNHIFRARVDKNFISPEFISISTKSNVARKYFFNNASQTVNLASINLTTLGGVPIFLPPLQEQYEIVRRVDELFRIADTIEAKYKTLKGKIDSLPQAILSKAFKGELVPQDPNDEPASVLLERIHLEKEKTKA